MSWAKATSPISARPAPSARPRRRGAASVPSMPLAPRLESTRASSRAGRNDSSSRTGIEAATNSVASAGSAAERRGDGGSVSSVAERRSRSRPRRRVGARHAVEPPGRPAPGGCGRRGVGAESRCRRPTRGPARRLLDRRICARVRARQPAPQRLRRRQVADPDHDLGRVLGGEARIAQQQVVVGDRGGAAAGPESGSASSG